MFYDYILPRRDLPFNSDMDTQHGHFMILSHRLSLYLGGPTPWVLGRYIRVLTSTLLGASF